MSAPTTALTPQEAAFWAFDEAHPLVLAEFVRLAHQAQDRGRKVGAKGLFEILRWNLPEGHPLLGVRLNNSLTAQYAREAMRRHPELDGFFETREPKA